VEVRINWPGRLSVLPVMGAFFFAMVGLEDVGEVMLYVGLAMALLASALYVRRGVRELRRSGAAGAGEGPVTGTPEGDPRAPRA
jgi:hypothetical protein